MRKRDTPVSIPNNSNFLEWSGPPGTFCFRVLSTTAAVRHIPDLERVVATHDAARRAYNAASPEEKGELRATLQESHEGMEWAAGFLVMLMWRDSVWELEAKGRYRRKWYAQNAEGDPRHAAGTDAFEELMDHGFADAEIYDLFGKLYAAQAEATSRMGAATGVESHTRFFGRESRDTALT